MERNCVWDDLLAQKRVADFLKHAATTGTVAHAYLFVGPTGAGKKTAARALACSLFCDDGGCGVCSICHRIRNGKHPDVHVFRPAGAATYMVEQVREVIHDVHLKPVQASHKVYIFEEADRFNAGSANAFLKTLEEPPDDVIIVLLTRSFDAVIPTIASRCQIVRFRPVPESMAIGVLIERSGATQDEARIALAASDGVISRALDFLESPVRRKTRDATVELLKRLPLMDGHDVLLGARTVLSEAKAPVEMLKAAQAEELAERKELFGKGISTKPIEDRHKRELTAREREGVTEVLSVAESWLRDCLVMSGCAPELVANADDADAIEEVAAIITPRAAVSAVEAVARARRRISYNVSPQLAVEAMLFDIQEVLRCPR
ncbi:MAG: DNA polymerase III subunit delta' [Coriobacteriia bacterium]|nr:DNA polymerase III subunit delta' [Coriobacteriia bacterium]